MAPESRVVGAGELVDHPKKIALHYLRTSFVIDLFVVLPLPQVSLSSSLLLIITSVSHMSNHLICVLVLCTSMHKVTAII